jgi:hypothetical protein
MLFSCEIAATSSHAIFTPFNRQKIWRKSKLLFSKEKTCDGNFTSYALPPRITGRLQRSQLLMRATRTSITAISTATVRRIRTSSAPSGVRTSE